MRTIIFALALCGAAAGGAAGGFAYSDHRSQHLRDCLAWAIPEPYCSTFSPPTGKAPAIAAADGDTKQIPGAPPGWRDATKAERDDFMMKTYGHR